MILPEGRRERERERERGAPRPFLRARCAFLSTTNRRVSVLPLSAPSLVPCSCHRGTRPLLPSLPPYPSPSPAPRHSLTDPPLVSFRPIPLLFRSPSFTLPRRSRRRYGRFDAEERRYQDDDLRRDPFFPAGRTIDPPTRAGCTRNSVHYVSARGATSTSFERALADRSAAPRRDPVSRRDRDSGIRDESLGTAWPGGSTSMGGGEGEEAPASLHLRRYIS